RVGRGPHRSGAERARAIRRASAAQARRRIRLLSAGDRGAAHAARAVARAVAARGAAAGPAEAEAADAEAADADAAAADAEDADTEAADAETADAEAADTEAPDAESAHSAAPAVPGSVAFRGALVADHAGGDVGQRLSRGDGGVYAGLQARHVVR